MKPPPKAALKTLRGLILAALVAAWLGFVLQPSLPATVLGLQPLDAGGWSALRSDIGGLLLGIGVFIALSFVGSARWLVPAIVLTTVVLITRLIGLAIDGPSAVGLLATLAELFAIAVLSAELFWQPWGLARHPYHPAYERLEWVWVPLHSRPLMGLFNRGTRLVARRVPLPTGLRSRRFTVRSPEGHRIPVEEIRPVGLGPGAPAVIWLHGGGFVMPENHSHRQGYARMAEACGCVVFAVDYRLAIDHPHPAGVDDCEAAVRHVFENAHELNISAKRIALGGDSAGGALTLATCLRLRDSGGPQPCAQVLVYPFLDETASSPSARRFIDTPVWNSRWTHQVLSWVVPDLRGPAPWDLAPGRAAHYRGLPPAWVETAEFDPLRDEGRALVDRLEADGVPVEHHEEPGTVHGFELVPDAPPTRAALRRRHAALSAALHRPLPPSEE